MNILVVIILFMTFLSYSYSNNINFDIKSSNSNNLLVPDSLVVHDRDKGTQYTFYNTSSFDLDAITSVKVDYLSSPILDRLLIYNYNGQMVHSTTNIPNKNSLNSLGAGLYMVETLYKNGKSHRNLIIIDGSNEISSSNNYRLNFFLSSFFDIYIYKKGYETLTLTNYSLEPNETIPLYMTPEFDKFYNRITLSINGVWKEGKVDSEVTENGNKKYSTHDTKVELKDEIEFKNTELRELNNACFDKVMEGINQSLYCSEDFPIKEDSIYFCGLECSKSSNSYSELYAKTMFVIFKESMDTVQFLNFHYRIGSYEESGYPSKKQTYKSVDIALSNLPVVEDSDKYTITLVNSQIKNHISFFYWNEFYDGIDFHPPFNRGKSTTNYKGELDIKSEAKIEIIIYKTK
jgi:hypothetical protein